MKVASKTAWHWPEVVAVCEHLSIDRHDVTSLSICVVPQTVSINRNGVITVLPMTGRDLWTEPVFESMVARLWGSIPQPQQVFDLKIDLSTGDALRVQCSFYATDTTQDDAA